MHLLHVSHSLESGITQIIALGHKVNSDTDDYSESDCDGGKKRYVYPGAMTLGKWNDAFTSFYCEDISTEGSTNGFKNSLVEQVQKEMMEDM